MSLLLDALKRAEQEKHARQPDAAPAAEAAAPRVAPAPSLELQPLTAAASAAQGGPARRVDPAAQSAQNVFQAKAGNAPPAPRNRTLLWVALGAIGIVAIAVGAYVWYSVKSLTPQYSATPRPIAAARPPPPGAVPPSAPAPGAFVPAPPATVAPSAAEAGAATSVGGTLSAVVPEPAPTPQPAPAPVTPAERIVREAASLPATPPLLLERTPAPSRGVAPGVANGYAALRLGDLATARRSYAEALAADATNVDAHLGMATTGAREGNRALAAEHYRRALDLDPRNAAAFAGLALLADLSRPEALEAQLRIELSRAPQSAALQFALGNLFASQSRWTEAQAAYYEAHRLDPGSADIAHNLAVSLDRLGQGRLAAAFYRRALENAQGHAAQFDAVAVARRLEELR